ncbi:MAG: transporter substrate-binding domain-containing protein [Eubacterium sp.]|nr:transporter substrate-binding domain-containing protein [Eubacterium sp.]
MKKFLAVLLAVLVVAFSFAACSNSDKTTDETTKAAADSDLAYVQEKGNLVIGITYFEPMDYIDENGELTGFEVEFGKAVCEKLGVEPKFQEISWDAKETELAAKNIDCIWNGMTTLLKDRKQ